MRIATSAGMICAGLCALALCAEQVGFEPPVTIEVDRTPSRILAADLDADGNVDIVLSAPLSRYVTLIHGNGDGTFGQGVEYELFSEPTALAVADLNGDGDLDIVTGHTGQTLTANFQLPESRRGAVCTSCSPTATADSRGRT
jgi:hypothetical protein